MRNDSLLVFFILLYFLLQMHFAIFSGFFGDFDPPWWTQYTFFRKRPAVIGFVFLWSTTVPNVAFQFSKTKVKKWFPCRVNYFLGFSKSPIHCSSSLAGVSLSLVRLAEQNKCNGRVPLVDAIMSCLVSKYSAYWHIWGEYNLYRFYNRKLKPLRNNASPSNTNNAHISRTTTRTPKISSPTCSPCSRHVDIFRFDTQRIPFWIARRWNFKHFPGTSS